MGIPKYDLEDRLVESTCRMINVVESLPDSRVGNYKSGQLIKSCHSPASNYGETIAKSINTAQKNKATPKIED